MVKELMSFSQLVHIHFFRYYPFGRDVIDNLGETSLWVKGQRICESLQTKRPVIAFRQRSL